MIGFNPVVAGSPGYIDIRISNSPPVTVGGHSHISALQWFEHRVLGATVFTRDPEINERPELPEPGIPRVAELLEFARGDGCSSAPKPPEAALPSPDGVGTVPDVFGVSVVLEIRLDGLVRHELLTKTGNTDPGALEPPLRTGSAGLAHVVARQQPVAVLDSAVEQLHADVSRLPREQPPIKPGHRLVEALSHLLACSSPFLEFRFQNWAAGELTVC